MKAPIYLDYAATTPVDGDALKAAMPYYTDVFYNPSSSHALGQKAAAALERARESCAAAINAEPDEIIFTSGGTEAINTAICAFADAGAKIAVSGIEHDAVISCANKAEKSGAIICKISPNSRGTVTDSALKAVISPETALSCVMAVNNQTGAVQPVKQLASASHDVGAVFFTDAVQAINSINVDVKSWGVDMLAASGHKFYAPKGVGFLYVKKGIKISPLILGGEQERNLRAGTPDLPAIVAMGEAIKKAVATREQNVEHIAKVRRAFLDSVNGEPVVCDENIPDIVTVVFDGVAAGRLSVCLSRFGVCCSVGSACSAGSATVPPTLFAMGVNNAECALRFSFGRQTTVEQAKAAAAIVNDALLRLK